MRRNYAWCRADIIRINLFTKLPLQPVMLGLSLSLGLGLVPCGLDNITKINQKSIISSANEVLQ